ncbi:MAG: MerR family transcriptional regulator [Chloroflexota bacterium]
MGRSDARSRRQRAAEVADGKYVMSVAVRLTGVEASRIRRYESAGLVSPDRTAGGQRLFSDPDIDVIREVARLENEGVNLKGIEVILRMKSHTR